MTEILQSTSGSSVNLSQGKRESFVPQVQLQLPSTLVEYSCLSLRNMRENLLAVSQSPWIHWVSLQAASSLRLRKRLGILSLLRRKLNIVLVKCLLQLMITLITRTVRIEISWSVANHLHWFGQSTSLISVDMEAKLPTSGWRRCCPVMQDRTVQVSLA